MVFQIFIQIFIRTSSKQTLETLFRLHVLRRLIWVCTVCICSTKRTLGLYRLRYSQRTSEYDQEMPQSHTTDQPTAPRGSDIVHRQPHDNKIINRGSYMSAHVLLILLNELGKRDKIRGLLNKYNNTRVLMLDSIYRMTLRSLISHLWRKNVIFLACTQRFYRRHNISGKSVDP